MRKEIVHFLLAAFILLLASSSCQKNEGLPAASGAGSKGCITFKAIEARETASKATFGNMGILGYPVLWEETDKTGVTVDYASEYVKAVITPSTDALYGTFKATLDAPSGSFLVQATVPEHALASYNTAASTVTLNIPASQTPSATGPDPMAMILVAEKELDTIPGADEAVELPFHHATAYGCVTLTNLPTEAEVDAIDLVFGVPVTGKWDYSPSGKSMTENVPSNVITLHTKSVENVYFSCAPGDLNGQSLKIRLITAQGVYEHAITISSVVAFSSGCLSRFTVNMANAQKKKSISILGIGHSFGQDSYWYLFDCLKQMGYEQIELGLMFKGNCSIEEHVNYYHAGTGHKTFHNNTKGTWKNTSNPVFADVLNKREWDYITMQQCVPGAGVPDSFDPWLDELTDIVRNHQPSAKLFYLMIWAFDIPYTGKEAEERLSPFNYDQMIMYDAFVNTTRERVMPTGIFGGLIPNGTAVQNLRTTSLEPSITRDTYHMSYDYGRLLTALMMCRVFANETIAGVTYTPAGYSYEASDIALIKEAVENAFVAPYTITPHGQTPGVINLPAGLSDTIVWDPE